MNFFEAQLDGGNGRVALRTPAFHIDLTPEQSAHLGDYRGKQVITGIRPEDLRGTDDHLPGETMQSVVEVVEPVGNETYVNVVAGKFTFTAAVGRKRLVKPHTNLVLKPNLENLHVFDPVSEKAIF